MPSSKPRGGGWTVATCLGTGAFFAAVAARKLADFDMCWHLAWGRYVLATRAVPRVDDFAYTHTPVEYVGILADVVMYGAYAAFGPFGAQCLGALTALALGVVLYKTARASESAVALVVAGFAMAAMSPWLSVRPATWSFVFFALDVYFLERHRTALDTSSQRRALVALPLVHLVWAQCHGAATLGLVVIAAYALHRWVARVATRWAPRLFPSEDGRGARDATLTLAVATVATSLNPWGIAYFAGPSRVMALGDLVTEWAASTPRFFVDDAPGAGAFILFSLIVLAAGRDPVTSRRHVALWDVGLLLAAASLSTRVRFVPYTIVLLAPVVARRASGALPKESPLLRLLPWTTLLVAPLVLLTDRTPLGIGLDPAHFSEPAVRFIETASPQGNMWNFPPFGGFLILRLYPRYRVLMDGRIGFVHETATIRQVIASDTDARAFDALVARHEIEWAVCGARQEERHCLPPATSAAWTMVYWDDVAAVYVRSQGPNHAMAERGYVALRHAMPLEHVLEAALAGSDRNALAHDADLAVAQDPTSPRALFVEACAALALRDPERGRASIERLATTAPGHPSIATLTAAWASLRHVPAPGR